MAEATLDRRQRWLVGIDYRLLGPLGPPLEGVLHGTALLKHPLHPAVTDAPLGAWLTDYHETYGHERRTGVLHGLTMITALSVMCASLGLRWWGGPGLHATAVGLATFGLVVSMAGMYVGGHLTFGMGSMVNRNAFAEAPERDYVPVGASTDFPAGTLARVAAGGMPVLVVRLEGRLCAIAAVCSHAGGRPLH